MIKARRKPMMTETAMLFEYPCPECGNGVVHTTRIRNYKTKIKGYPFSVDEALIGVYDHCQAKPFTPEEQKRWEEHFFQSLESRKAFLTPREITEIRTALELSMEDFARLIGTTRQSLSTWEKTERASPPSRTADLLMKLVRQALHGGTVDVLSVLLEEAKKWGIVMQIRGTSVPAAQDAVIVLRPKSARLHPPLPQTRERTLAAEAAVAEEAPYVVETADGRSLGVLRYDYERAALMLDITGPMPPWDTASVEIETQDGQRFTRQVLLGQEPCLLLIENSHFREKDIVRLTLKVQPEERRE